MTVKDDYVIGWNYSDCDVSFSNFILTRYKSIWLLFIVLLIRSAGTGVQTPAVNALIPQIVPKEYLMKVNGINSSITSLIMFLSPAASAAILSIASIETTFLLMLLRL